MNPSIKTRHVIQVWDNRGTSMSVSLFLYPSQVGDYVRELTRIWDSEYSGKADLVTVNSVEFQRPPAGFGKPDAHTST